MRLIARLVWLVAALTGCPALLLADTAAETATTQSQTVQDAAGESEAPLEVDHTKPAQVNYNFTQPQVPELPAMTSEPVALLPLIGGGVKDVLSNATSEAPAKPKKIRKRQRKTVAKRRQASGTKVEQPWWEHAKDTAVLEFRDCLDTFAQQQSVPATAQAPRLVISRAMDEECRTAFDDMAAQMYRQFGKERFDQLSEQLISEVFVPTVVRHISIDSGSQRVASDG
jgi:hypothetical protein